MDTLTILKNHLAKLQNLNPDRRLLIVFKGFTFKFFEHIESNKLFNTKLDQTIEELDNEKVKLIPQIFTQTNSQEWVWCTYEELLVVGEELLSLYFSVHVIRNNLFNYKCPALYSIGLDPKILVQLGEDEPDIDDNGNEHITLIYKYYGSIRLINNHLFVTYVDQGESDISFYPVTGTLSVIRTESANINFELSDSEEDFISFQDRLLSGSINSLNVHIAYSGDFDHAPFRYKERLLIIQQIIKDRTTIILVNKEITSKVVAREAKYLPILQRYWGHSSFRKLKMYKNIQSRGHNKEIVEISQGQIIDDLVQQSLKARENDDYKDVFVTSPTGAGKSVMFQIPAIFLAENYGLMTIVISPLIGLMNDQVQGLLSRNVEISATINSGISPIEKTEIRNKIQEGKISILYISPETLLSRSDISQLIGKREVGLFVIDEAHIVTTWGKAFRSDYWYLGVYLSKLRKDMNFPVATFTATAIYGGIEDMYVETRDSLNLVNPISYFGYVKRDDLEIRIKKKEDYNKRFNEYLIDKNKILLNRVEQFVKEKRKTLVYFPTVRTIIDFKEFVRIYGSESLRGQLSIYYGSLDKEQKQENYLRFKNNDSLVMLATKAFGMGIDIPDIDNVYHLAPTGNVCDYIQEIGRAARDLPVGYAFFDFLPQDFVHVKRLHGISTIKKSQLIEVMRKIVSILDTHKGMHVRNLLVSADEFRYIFQDGSSREINDDVDNKIKTALLIIEKDFQAKMTYSPIVARPRSIFANEFFLVHGNALNEYIESYGKYFTLVSTIGNSHNKRLIYSCNLKAVWQENYQKMSYPEFKHHFHSTDGRVKLPFQSVTTPVLQIKLFLKHADVTSFHSQVRAWAEKIGLILGKYAKSKTYFTIEDISRELQKSTQGLTKYSAEMMSHILIESCGAFDRLMRQSNNFYNRFIAFDESRNKYHLLSTGYAGFTDWILAETQNIFLQPNNKKIEENEYEVYFPKVFENEQEKRFMYLGLMEAFGLLTYRINGGDNPEIYIRIFSRLKLEQAINNPVRYQNLILENVSDRHKLSVGMLTYLFEKQVDTVEFWNYIEDYFLGKIPEEVMQRLS